MWLLKCQIDILLVARERKTSHRLFAHPVKHISKFSATTMWRVKENTEWSVLSRISRKWLLKRSFLLEHHLFKLIIWFQMSKKKRNQFVLLLVQLVGFWPRWNPIRSQCVCTDLVWPNMCVFRSNIVCFPLTVLPKHNFPQLCCINCALKCKELMECCGILYIFPSLPNLNLNSSQLIKKTDGSWYCLAISFMQSISICLQTGPAVGCL